MEPAGIGLDRIDSDIGYLPYNVQPMCRRCNSFKSRRTQAQWDELLSRFVADRFPIYVARCRLATEAAYPQPEDDMPVIVCLENWHAVKTQR